MVPPATNSGAPAGSCVLESTGTRMNSFFPVEV
jgi:hypothetical protein